jgi:hypothetical protein
MAKRIALANPTTCATGITGAGGGAKSGLMAKGAFVSLLVQIPDRLAFVTQRTNVLPRNDLTSQAVDFVALRRRPAAKVLDAFQQAQPEDLGIFAQPHQINRVLARRDRIAGRKFKISPRCS